MHRLFAVAAAMTWAISPQWLSTILTIANREGAGPEAVAKELGRPLDNTRKVEMRGDVAIIPVCGPIFRRANMLSEVSGATSIQVLAQDFNAALANEEVKSIVLEIDSPGGEVTGVSEFAEMVFAARGTKPIVAYVGGDGCSAAYWIASACEHIVVADTAIVGSIGVVRAIPNPGAGTASAIEIVSSQSPNKRPDVKTSKGRAVFQAEVDALADVFVSTVARNRGVSTKTVLKSFGQGGCLIGRNAVDAGMADAVGALESVIASFVPRAQAQETAVAAANPNPAPEAPAPVTTRKEPPMSKRLSAVTAMAAIATIASLAGGSITADGDPPEDDKDKDKADDAPESSSEPTFAVGDAVMVGDRAAEVTDVRNGPHYAIQFTDGDAEAFQWASEDELEPASGDAADDQGDDPDASDDEDKDSPSAIRARRLAAENRALKAQLAGANKTVRKATAGALVAKMKADKKWSPAMETVIRSIAAKPMSGLDAISAFVAVMPRLAPVASVHNPPPAKPKDGATAPALTFNGKSYGELSMGEKHALAVTEPDLFQQMKSAHDAANAKS